MNENNTKHNEYMREYRKRKTFKQLKVDIKPEDFIIIDNYCKDIEISKAKFIVKCCKYCIDHDINFDD
ncbi:hypothetical protein I2400191J7_18010 [Ruminococcus bicirculans (ex Wegman et al. 2014)]|jgi:hypothetical protein|nr:MAG TPA_asm: hypothetical protein [Caudoviricetes sp.]DAV64553.1 MAG TPA: hypothetical protein [Caudoviricetes sp.]